MKKATESDNIYNDLLKSQRLCNVLCELFQSCFDSGISPTQWHKSAIKPIPKSSKNNHKLPLSFEVYTLLAVYTLDGFSNNLVWGHIIICRWHSFICWTWKKSADYVEHCCGMGLEMETSGKSRQNINSTFETTIIGEKFDCH